MFKDTFKINGYIVIDGNRMEFHDCLKINGYSLKCLSWFLGGMNTCTFFFGFCCWLILK